MPAPAHRSRPHPALALLAAALLAGCASRGQAPTDDARPDPRVESTRSGRRVITLDDIRKAAPDVTHAYDVVQRLRPEFLRGEIQGTSTTLPLVYIDGRRAGGTDALRTIQRGTIERIELITAADAGTRYSDARGAPVLLVRTLR